MDGEKRFKHTLGRCWNLQLSWLKLYNVDVEKDD